MLVRQAIELAARADFGRLAPRLRTIANELEANKPRRKLKPRGSPGDRVKAAARKRGVKTIRLD